MTLSINKEDQKMIMTMIENGVSNGRISLKFPGITKKQIEKFHEEINKGTEQTKRKLKRDPLLGIYRKGDIEISELYAAEYIRYAFSLITADVALRVMNFDGYVDIIGRGATEQEGPLQARVQNQYADWFDECSKKRIKVGPVIHILTEPVTLRDTDKYFGFRRGRSRDYLVAGLKLYVEMFKPRAGIAR
ncbi:MAG: hypothetical protein JKY84_02650 [Emcibacteraceae bacterium]|nr:hypothetical protein [Emcibacteraceae bacterium]